MDKYHDREQAGAILAQALFAYENSPHCLVLALPRGGVPVAFQVAKRLNLPLDVFIVRKLGMPDFPELAFGAIASGDIRVLNHEVIRDAQLSASDIEVVTQQEKLELKRRELAYRHNLPFPDLTEKTIILVDDGIATGATMSAAIAALRQLKAKKIIAAVPVAEKSTAEAISSLVDEFVCPLQPKNFQAVGLWYDLFPQTEDDEVHKLLNKMK